MFDKRSRTAWTRGLVATGAAAAAVLSTTPAQAVEGATAKDSFQFTAKLDIGGERSCSAALVDEQWLITAASCFADNPAQDVKIAAGAPKLKTTATIGRTDLTRDNGAVLDVVQLVPREDRDVVLARLAKPMTGVTPAAIAAGAPIQGEELRVTGYGRTKNEWVPDTLHYASFTVGSVKDTSIGLAGKSADAVICQGDTGGPAFRDVGGRQELVGVNSRSWQGGCLGNESETRKGAVDTRVDDLGDWIAGTTSRLPLDQTIVAAGDYNGDGVTDLYTLSGSRELSVWAGKKAGRFAAPRSLTGDWSYTETVSADFDGDGVTDLIARDAKNNLYRWPGNKNGVFGRPVPVTTNNWVYTQMVAGDFNGDGKADLIAMGGDKTLWMWSGKGDGTFSAGKEVTTKNWFYTQTVAADFNGDGVTDLIARDANKNLLRWNGNKNGAFSGASTLTSGDWNYIQTTAGDFNGDGKADLIAKDEGAAAPYMWLWNGRGNGLFAAKVKLSEGL
ncbi:FG-GAP-like repeat-containing protein [Streptomyces sp. NPDC037389]|uniref:FG-GAP-like repeat-containing protein n=1 Tax=Streptomyces sp. NPDC037389 TaxID=3155369 RepID=UPI0033E0DBAF